MFERLKHQMDIVIVFAQARIIGCTVWLDNLDCETLKRRYEYGNGMPLS
jgi:hypothetical protein